MSSMCQILVRVEDTMVNEITQSRSSDQKERDPEAGTCTKCGWGVRKESRILGETGLGHPDWTWLAGCRVVMGKASWKKLLWGTWQPWNNPLGFPFKKELALQLLRAQFSESIWPFVLSGFALAFKWGHALSGWGTSTVPAVTVHRAAGMVAGKGGEWGEGGLWARL